MTKVVWQQNFFNTFLTNSWWNCFVSSMALCNMMQHGSAPTEWKITSFTMLPKKTRAKACDGFPPHCQHTALVQGVCRHDPRTSGAVIGKFSTRSTTRFSFRPKNGRTRCDNKSHFGQEQRNWTPIVDHQLGFIRRL